MRCSKSIRSAGRSTTSPIRRGRAKRAGAISTAGARDIDAIYAQQSVPRLAGLERAVRQFGLRREDFHAVIDGMDMDVVGDIRAPDDATLDLYCDRVASAVGRLSVRVFGMPEADGIALAHHLGRALQLTNILRDIDEDAAIGRLYLPAEELRAANIAGSDPAGVLASPGIEQVCGVVADARAPPFRRGRPDHVAQFAQLGARTAHHVRGLQADPRSPDRARMVAAARSGPPAAAAADVDHHALRVLLMAKTVHIIGAGLAGLAAAVRLAGRGVTVLVHEAAGQAGGRCRSYHDPALDMMIDNGNHLLLSGNHAALSFLATIGNADGLVGPPSADFDFADLKSGARWTIRINAGRVPWWIFNAGRRVPDTKPGDYLAFARLLWGTGERTICEVVNCAGPLYDRLARPLFVAALNTEPQEASAALAGAIVRETLLLGGAACRPLIARDGLGAAFIEPALRHLETRGVQVRFGSRLRDLEFGASRVTGLDFAEQITPVGDGDAVILAVPPVVATSLLPGLTAPTEFRAIVNAHFRIDPPAGLPPILGLVNATTEWLFAYPGRLSVTISAADRLLDVAARRACRDRSGGRWRRSTGLPKVLPPWQIVRERRATFAATPPENARRPGATTEWRNLVLAGDWTQTGLPATIEGAIRSGNRAADLVLA